MRPGGWSILLVEGWVLCVGINVFERVRSEWMLRWQTAFRRYMLGKIIYSKLGNIPTSWNHVR